MSLPEKPDLHMHSTVSDGTDRPEELREKVMAAGLDLFALTDHDAIKGCAAVIACLETGDPAFLTGVEFSCRDEEGRYHILGYGYDPETKPIREVVAEGHALRMEKLEKRLAFLRSEYGFSFSAEDREALFALDNPGKPHIGNLMVRYGYAPSREAAIRGYLDRYSSGSANVRPETAIRGILDSGGIPVLAHPAYGRGDELILGEEMERRLRRLTDFGLQGMEAFYSGFSPKLTADMLAFARKYGLYTTAGSDYHGTNKLVRLGDTNLPAAELYPEGLHRFLETVESRLHRGGGQA